MYYLNHDTGYAFVDYLMLSPITHLSYAKNRVFRRTLCGKVYRRVTLQQYARHMCEECLAVGIVAHAVRPGAFAYALPIQLPPWSGTWVGEMCDEVTAAIFGSDAEVAVGPFCSLDDAWYYARNIQYRTAQPSDIPGIRLAHVVADLAAIHGIYTINMRPRPAGVQIAMTLSPHSSPGVLYTIIEELDAAGQSLGYGPAIVPANAITDASLTLLVPYSASWGTCVRAKVDHYVPQLPPPDDSYLFERVV